jgi:hypothetical protein
MAETSTPTLIILREGVIQSIVKDTYTLGLLAALPWFNYRYCGGSGWIFFAIAFAWFIVMCSRASGEKAKATKTPEQARAWLDEQYPVEPQ